MKNKVFAKMFFLVYKVYLARILRANLGEELALYDLPTDLPERLRLISWFAELGIDLDEAKTIKEVATVEANWSENFDEDEMPQIMYHLDDLMSDEGDLDESSI